MGLSLKQFSQQTVMVKAETDIRPPESPMVEPQKTYTVIWPAGANVAVIGEQWQRLPDGRIKAVYHSLDEWEMSVTISQWVKEWDTEEPASPEQLEMFATQTNHYQMELAR